jgi:hypothetical protein
MTYSSGDYQELAEVVPCLPRLSALPSPGTRGRDLVLLTAAAEGFLDALRIGGSDALVDRQCLL